MTLYLHPILLITSLWIHIQRENFFGIIMIMLTRLPSPLLWEMCPIESFLLRPYICYILLCIKHSCNHVFLSINVLTNIVEICFFYMFCHEWHYSEQPIVLLYQFGIRISAFCYLSFHFSWLYVLSLIMIMIHDKDVLFIFQQQKKSETIYCIDDHMISMSTRVISL